MSDVAKALVRQVGPDQAIGTEPAAEMNKVLTIRAPKIEAAMLCMLANEKVIVCLLNRPLDHPAVMPGVQHGACQLQKTAQNCGFWIPRRARWDSPPPTYGKMHQGMAVRF